MLPLVDCCLLKISYCRLGIAAVVAPCLLCVLWVDCWFWICFPLLLPLFPLASLHHGVVCCRHPSTAPPPPKIIVVSLHSKHRHCLMRCASALPMHCASALPKSTCPPLLSLVDCCSWLCCTCHSLRLLQAVNALHNGVADDDTVSTATHSFSSFTGLCSSCCHCLPRCTTVLPMLTHLNYCHCCAMATITARFIAAVVLILKPCFLFLLVFLQATVTAAGPRCSVGDADGVSTVTAGWLSLFTLPTTVVVAVVVAACSIVMRAGAASTAASCHCFLLLDIASLLAVVCRCVSTQCWLMLTVPHRSRRGLSHHHFTWSLPGTTYTCTLVKESSTYDDLS